MITLQCQIEFQNKQDKKVALDLMRRFSSAMRYAYQRLLEGEKRKDLKKILSKLFNINIARSSRLLQGGDELPKHLDNYSASYRNRMHRGSGKC